MENSNQPEITQAISEDKSYYVSTHFESDEAMKAYYLQMADNMNISRQIGENPEYVALKNVLHKLKQYVRVLQYVCDYEWGRGVSEIHDACGVYLMQKNIEHRKLVKFNEEIGQHLQFIAKLAGDTGFMKQLQGYLAFHMNNVDFLVRGLRKQFEKTEI